ncbi:penicillin-binding transpeptidase domain-containing protein, partial [Candidatus Omnitrophota bacterium]
DSRGNQVHALGYRPPTSGRNIQLTLDLKIQKIVEDEMGERKGAVIIIDPSNGEILAMASRPGFNPEAFIKKKASYVHGLFNDSQAPLINRAITGLYPAGSVFKLVVATAALEKKKISSGTSYECTGSIRIGGSRFSCWNTHGDTSIVAGIARSCNVFFWRTGLLTGANLIHAYAVRFGMARETKVDIPYESVGQVPNPVWRRLSKFQKWYDGDTANLSIGQGELMVTPIQLLRMICVFANRGNLVRPYLLKAVGEQDISSYQRKVTSLGLKQSTISTINQGLRGTISDPEGTANILSGLSVSVAGKTGTAQVGRAEAHGWFVGYFPYKSPKFAICVFLENSGSGYVSGVLAKKIIQRMIKEGLI